MYKSLCLDVKKFKKNNTIEFQEKFPKLEIKMMKKYNMFKAEIAAFEQEFSEHHLDNSKINSKYSSVYDNILSTTNQLKEFLPSHGIEVTPKINLTEMVTVMFNDLALEIPQKSKEKARKIKNAK